MLRYRMYDLNYGFATTVLRSICERLNSARTPA